MRVGQQTKLWLLVGAVVVGGCAAPSQPATERPVTSAAQSVSAPKRLVAAVRGNPVSVSNARNSGGGGRIDGALEMGGLTSSGLAVIDRTGQFIPVLAERLPSVDNGQWRVLADGRMETSWVLREGIFWHDGTPLTADDVAFTAKLARDRDMPWIIDPVYGFIDTVEAVDVRTVKVTWKEPYIRADQVTFQPLFPRHLLEDGYQATKAGDKDALPGLPYWTTEFVGSGPFQVKEFVRDSHLALRAFDRYVLGRPKIDELEVRFVADDNALGANVLAGVVDLTVGPGMSIEQGIQVRDRWPQGGMRTGPNNSINLNPQFLNPDPAILLNVQFRRALYMAIDRKNLADELMYGLSDVAHSTIHPSEPEYRAVEPGIVRYEYDPRRATQMIEELGYRKGPDGMLQDAAGKPLSIQIMATQDDSNLKPQLAVLDGWKSIGITPDAEPVTAQRQRDLPYRANFRSFSLQSGVSSGADGVSAMLTREARTPERNYLGRNYTRYSNQETDVLVDRYFTTIPFNERMQVLRQIINHTTDNLVWMGLYWRILPTLMHERLVGVSSIGEGDQWANAHLWDVR